MPFLITGGNGHIRSWIVYLLAKQNKKSIIYNRKEKEYPDYLESVRDKITFIQGDVLDFARLTDIVKKNRNSIIRYYSYHSY